MPLAKEPTGFYFLRVGKMGGTRPPKNIERQLKPFIYSTYKIQKIKNSWCASFCLYILYLVKVKKYSFEEAVLYLFYQRK